MKRLLIAAATASCLFGQEIQQKTQGKCSPAVVSNGNVTITCTGVDPNLSDHFRRFSSLLDKLVKQQIDPGLISSKLDEVLRIQKETVQQLKEQGQRRMSSADSERLSEALRGVNTEGVKVKVYHSIMNIESARYALDFLSAVRAAGWAVEHAGGTDLGFGRSDVLVVLPDPIQAEKVSIASALINGLKEIGISAGSGKHRIIKAGELGLVIPPK